MLCPCQACVPTEAAPCGHEYMFEWSDTPSTGSGESSSDSLDLLSSLEHKYMVSQPGSRHDNGEILTPGHTDSRSNRSQPKQQGWRLSALFRTHPSAANYLTKEIKSAITVVPTSVIWDTDDEAERSLRTGAETTNDAAYEVCPERTTIPTSGYTLLPTSITPPPKARIQPRPRLSSPTSLTSTSPLAPSSPDESFSRSKSLSPVLSTPISTSESLLSYSPATLSSDVTETIAMAKNDTKVVVPLQQKPLFHLLAPPLQDSRSPFVRAELRCANGFDANTLFNSFDGKNVD